MTKRRGALRLLTYAAIVFAVAAAGLTGLYYYATSVLEAAIRAFIMVG